VQTLKPVHVPCPLQHTELAPSMSRPAASQTFPQHISAPASGGKAQKESSASAVTAKSCLI
jgi:hypothetical protein